MRRFSLVFLALCSVVLSLSGSARARSDRDERMFEEWVKLLKPDMMPLIHKRAEEADKHHHKESDKYFDRSLSMFDVIKMYMADHGSQIDGQVAALMGKYQSGKNPLREGALECEFTPQCPPTPAKTKPKLVECWREFTRTVQDPASCDPCQTFLGNVKDTACEQPWETVRDDLIDLCENLLFPILDLDPVMCNGSITLQGEHLYCILKEASPFELCESLNLCYPLDAQESTDKPPVSERTPWALKDSLQPELQKTIARRQRGRRVRRQAENVTIVQLTDIHMQPKYTVGSPTDCKAAICCLDDSLARDGTEYARKWGEYSCNVPERTVLKFLEKVNEFSPNFVLYAGDSPPHTLWDETLTSQLNCSNIVVNAMKNTLTPGTRVYPAIGNHEMFPTNLYSSRMSETAEMNQGFTRMWHDLAGMDASANATFADMSYYTMLHQPGLRVMVINSNYDWYTANFYNSLNKNDSSSAEHKAFVETTLQNARAIGEKVVVVSHHPVHSGTVRSVRWWQQVASEYSDVIVLHVSGHTHNDEFDMILDPVTDEPKGVNLVSPTVTTNTNVNPSLRVFTLDSTTFELLESECHYFDLTTQNPDADPEIVLNYNTKTEYGLVDLSPESFQELLFRFIDDEALFQAYYDNRYSKAARGPCSLDNVCGADCKANEICGIWFPSPDEAADCRDSWNFTVAAAEREGAPVVHAGAWGAHVEGAGAVLVGALATALVGLFWR